MCRSLITLAAAAFARLRIRSQPRGGEYRHRNCNHHESSRNDRVELFQR